MKSILFLLISSLILTSIPISSGTDYLYTPQTDTYQYWIDPKLNAYNGNFCFDVRANRDAFIMLAGTPIEDIYDGPNIEINIGCCLNSQIMIRSNGTPVAQTVVLTPSVLNEDTFNSYCIKWNNGLFEFYRNNSILTSYRTNAQFPVKAIGFRKWFDGGATWIYNKT